MSALHKSICLPLGAFASRRFAHGFAVVLLAAAIFSLNSVPAHAALTRPYQGAVAQGAFISERSPGSIAVDQSNGDIYALEQTDFQSFSLLRFDSSGAPKNFTAGPGAGTNTITGFKGTVTQSSPVLATEQVAVDNSSGPLAGTIYVTTGTQYFPFTSDGRVKAYAPTGAELGALDGSDTLTGDFRRPCGVAVDPSDGSVYVASYSGGQEGDNDAYPALWRYAPASPVGAIDDSDFTVTGIRAFDCNLAAFDGTLYSVERNGDQPLLRRSASQFTTTPGFVSATVLGSGFRTLATDPATGEIYAESGRSQDGLKVSVFDPAGDLSYRFGAAAYYGSASAGLAVRSAPSGPATKIYVADPTAHELDTFGLPVNAPVVQHPELHRFGPDGTNATAFGSGSGNAVGPAALAFDSSSSRLFAVDPTVPGIYGFDASSPPPYLPLAGFSPLSTAAPGVTPGLAADPATGNLYLASSETELIYGFDSSGASLGGAFPIDPATTPGAPAGSPKDLCGAAVSSTGELFVSNSATKRVLRYSSAGAFQGSIDVSPQPGASFGPCDLAFAPNNDLYVSLYDKGVYRYTAASSYASASLVDQNRAFALAVDPASGDLYAAHEGWVDEWDASGDLVSEFFPGGSFEGAAVDPASGHLFLADRGFLRKIRVFRGDTVFPEATAKPADALANTSATLRGQVSGQNLALADCHFEYVTDLAFQSIGFTDLSSGGSADCDPNAASIPVDLDSHDVAADVSSLDPNTTYRFRLVAENVTGSTASDSLPFTTTAPPGVETTGTPLRTDTTTTLLGRVYPVRVATTYHFEWGTDTSYGNTTPDRSAGSGDEVKFVEETISGLSPGTTYHYRLVADNGNADGPSLGEDMTVTTKPGPDPVLDHGSFPGPPGSDRAWELVSLADASGNPAISGGIAGAPLVSPDGERAAYRISGGSPIAESGNAFSSYVAQRPPGAHPTSGWQSIALSPPRDEQLSQILGSFVVAGSADLAHFYFTDTDPTVPGGGHWAFWRLDADGSRSLLFDAAPPRSITSNVGILDIVNSAEGTRLIAAAHGGSLDPAFPAATAEDNLYDVSAGGAPQLASLLPGEVVPTCGALVPTGNPFHNAMLSPDGELLLFASQGAGPCNGGTPISLYLRDLSAGSTEALPDTPLSGPACQPDILTATPGAFFFATPSRLASDDVTPTDCESKTYGDVYRYDVADESLDCVTCPGPIEPSGFQVARIADDGSRLYFTSGRRLLPGVASDGGFYRVEVATGALAFVSPFSGGPGASNARLSADGSRLYFHSSGSGLDPLGPDAATNSNTNQVYLYDDTDRSLLCVSCPPDGSAPLGDSSLPARPSDDGIGAFATPDPLLAADHNTNPAQPFRGTDAYEWRDGRLLLVTDGTSSWPEAAVPVPGALSASGRDLVFTASARLTFDALDDVFRVYDARIGGGIDFPPEGLPPCDLNSGACEGAPSRAGEVPGAGSAVFEGQGNQGRDRTPKTSSCPKGKRKVRSKGKVRCVKPHAKKNNHRRSAR